MEIVLVSDDRAFRSKTDGHAAMRSLSVRALDSVSACIEHLAKRSCDILVVDMYRHQGSDGRFLRWFKQTHPSSAVIVLSESDCETEMRASFRDGATAFMIKPISVETLADTIRHIRSEQEATV